MPRRTIGLGRLSRALWITKLSARMVWSGSIVEVAPIGAPQSSQNVAKLLFCVRQKVQAIVSSLLVISFLLAIFALILLSVFYPTQLRTLEQLLTWLFTKRSGFAQEY
jgi:hypothetical protein